MNKITLGFITCQRYNLFLKTFNSLLKNFKEWDLVSEIILVDDNSELPDVILMMEMLKKLNKPVIFVSKKEFKSHPKSLNILFSLISNDYLFLCEDDWECIKSDNFINKAFEIFKKHDDLVQVQFHRKAEITAVGQKVLKLNGTKYVKYDYDVKSVDPLGRPSFPGYTNNPSLINIKKLKENDLHFRDDVLGFEYNYACMAAGKGMKICYFTENYFKHIGKNHSAYKLNSTRR